MAVGCRRQTNNSVRTTAVTNMLEGGLSERDIAGVTGHLALANISHYDRTKMDRRYVIADAIMRIPERNVASTETTASQVESRQVENLLKDQENTVIVTSKFSL